MAKVLDAIIGGFNKINESEYAKKAITSTIGAGASFFTARALKKLFTDDNGKKQTTTVSVTTEVEGKEPVTEEITV